MKSQADKRKSGAKEDGFADRYLAKLLLAETLFKRLKASHGKIESYELNPPFTIFCSRGRYRNGSAKGSIV
jgi:hypothetical protein